MKTFVSMFALIVMAVLMGTVVLADGNGAAPTGAVVTGGPPDIVYGDRGVATSINNYRVLYTKPDPDSGKPSVWMFIQKSEERIPVAFDAENAVWNPTGDKCAYWVPFSTENGRPLYSLVIHNLSTGKAARVNAYTADQWRKFDWTRPDIICYDTVRGGRSAIFEFTISTHGVQRVSPWGGLSDFMDPQFRGGFYYCSNAGEGLVKMALEDGQIRYKKVVLKEWSSDFPIRSINLTPAGPIVSDGRAVYWWESDWYLSIAERGARHPVFSMNGLWLAYSTADGWFMRVYNDFGLG